MEGGSFSDILTDSVLESTKYALGTRLDVMNIERSNHVEIIECTGSTDLSSRNAEGSIYTFSLDNENTFYDLTNSVFAIDFCVFNDTPKTTRLALASNDVLQLTNVFSPFKRVSMSINSDNVQDIDFHDSINRAMHHLFLSPSAEKTQLIGGYEHDSDNGDPVATNFLSKIIKCETAGTNFTHTLLFKPLLGCFTSGKLMTNCKMQIHLTRGSDKKIFFGDHTIVATSLETTNLELRRIRMFVNTPQPDPILDGEIKSQLLSGTPIVHNFIHPYLHHELFPYGTTNINLSLASFKKAPRAVVVWFTSVFADSTIIDIADEYFTNNGVTDERVHPIEQYITIAGERYPRNYYSTESATATTLYVDRTREYSEMLKLTDNLNSTKQGSIISYEDMASRWLLASTYTAKYGYYVFNISEQPITNTKEEGTSIRYNGRFDATNHTVTRGDSFINIMLLTDASIIVDTKQKSSISVGY